MLKQQDMDAIISLAKQYNVKEIYLFGSSLEDEARAADIDLAVRGLKPGLFFDFYGKLLHYLSKPVDLVDLSKKRPITEAIERRAVKIYG